MEIDALKKKYGRVYEITIEDDGATYTGYFRRPDMATLSAFTKLSQTDPAKAAHTLVANCMVDGDDAIKEDPILMINAAGSFGSIINKVKASLKNV